MATLTNKDTFSFQGAVLGFCSVALGAFAAHALKERLSAYHLEVFQTGVHYQMAHSLVLLLLPLLQVRTNAPQWLNRAGHFFFAGTVIFSGSLYLLAVTEIPTWGAVTPIGGVSLLFGWLALCWALYPRKSK